MVLNTEGNLSVSGNIASSKSITGSNLSVAGALNGISFNDVGAGKNLNKSFVGSVNVDGTWYNLINIRHRNGATDGDSYGLQIRNALTDKTNRLYVRSQYGNADSWSEWEPIYTAKSLFDNASGDNGTITLNESAANFLYLEIYYLDNSKTKMSSVKIYNPNGKIVGLGMHGAWFDGVSTDIRTRNIGISGNTIVNQNQYAYIWFKNNAIQEHSQNNYLYIVKVVGYR